MLTATIKSSFALGSDRGEACLRQTGETLVAFIHCLHPPSKIASWAEIRMVPVKTRR